MEEFKTRHVNADPITHKLKVILQMYIKNVRYTQGLN